MMPSNPASAGKRSNFTTTFSSQRNTGLRPDEAMRVQFRDVSVVEDEGSGQTILEIEVRGKRGVGYCKSTAGTVRPFERLKTRTRPEGGMGRSGSRTASMANGEWHEPGLTDLLFPKWPRDLLNAILTRKSFGLTAMVGRERPTAFVIPTFAFACSKVPTSIRLRRTAGQAWR